MKARVFVLVLGLLLLSPYASAEQKTVDVTKVKDGVYEIRMDGMILSAYTTEELRKKLNTISELKSHIDSLENLRKTQKTMIEKQQEQLALMDAQNKDLQTEVSKLKQIHALEPAFSASAGVGYLNSEALGMLGVGYGDWHLMGLLQPSSAGILLSRDF